MKIILQHDERDCGAACLAMIAEYYGFKIPLSKSRELTKSDRNGCTIYGIVDGATKIGLQAEALFGTKYEFMDEINNKNILVPFIAHVIIDNNYHHFIVIEKINENKIYIKDPSRGSIDMSLDTFFEYWTGHIITFKVSDSFQKANEKKGRFKKFIKITNGLQRKLFFVLITSIIIAAVGVLASYTIGYAIDKLEYIVNTYSENTYVYALNPLFIGLIIIYSVQAIISYIRGRLVIDIEKKVDSELSLGYYNHIVDLPISSIALRQTGEYLSRFSDISVIRDMISRASITLLFDTIMGICGAVILLKINKTLFFISLTILIAYLIIVLVFRKPLDTTNRESMELDSKLQSFFKESIDGINTIKASRAEDRIKNKTSVKFHHYLNSIVKLDKLSTLQDILIVSVELIGTTIILWLGFIYVLSGDLSLGELLTFNMMLGYFTEPIKSIIELQPSIQAAIASVDRLNDILDLKKEEEEDTYGNKSIEQINEWKLVNCDFRYGNRDLVLHDINLSIKKGEKIAIVGESGSGKTTIVKLLLKYYLPERGTILVDNIPINKISSESIRKKISYVDQNTFLFSDTIKNNLLLGNPNATDKEIESICKACLIDKYIKSLPLGYDTLVDENGMNLSGGQRQRLSIARGLLKNPELLILDEATSNLDTITESSIKQAINRITTDMSVIIIAHRLSTIKECDKIVVMKDGCIVEEGKFTELIENHGSFYEYWKSMS